LTSRDRQYLLDILLHAEDALTFVRGASFDDLGTNVMLRNAVLHSLTILGEAAGRVAELAEAEIPALPWRRMKNLRNVIVHDYEGVNLPIIWEIVTVELPVVVAVLDPLFPERPKP
jgi:uncharacterized protein with HEPN domain